MKYVINRNAMQAYLDAYVKTPRDHGSPIDEGLLFKRIQTALQAEYVFEAGGSKNFGDVVTQIELDQGEFSAMIRTFDTLFGQFFIEKSIVR